MHLVLLIAWWSADLVLAGLSTQHQNMDIQILSQREIHCPIAPAQPHLLRRMLHSDWSSQQSQSTHSQNGPPPRPLPRYPSPVDKTGRPLGKDPTNNPRVDLQMIGPATMATRGGNDLVLPGSFGRVYEIDSTKAIAGGMTHNDLPPSPAPPERLPHTLKAHAQGRTARLGIKVPPGGSGSYIIGDASGQGRFMRLSGGADVEVGASSQARRGAHVHGSVTHGGQIVATASNSPPRPARHLSDERAATTRIRRRP